MRRANRRPKITTEIQYPSGFASRFLEWARAAGPGWGNVDAERGELNYVDDDGRVSARIRIDDEGLIPRWRGLVGEGRALFPRLSDEERAMVMLSLSIEEFVLTTDDPRQPRYFTLRDMWG